MEARSAAHQQIDSMNWMDRTKMVHAMIRSIGPYRAIDAVQGHKSRAPSNVCLPVCVNGSIVAASSETKSIETTTTSFQGNLPCPLSPGGNGEECWCSRARISFRRPQRCTLVHHFHRRCKSAPPMDDELRHVQEAPREYANCHQAWTSQPSWTVMQAM